MASNAGVQLGSRSNLGRIARILGRLKREGGRIVRSPQRLKKTLRRRVRGMLLPEEAPWGPEYRGYTDEDLAVFQAIPVRRHRPEPGFVVDFLGARTRLSSLKPFRYLDGKVLGLPVTFADRFHAETVEWVGLMKSVLSARDHYVALELGAGWGPWLVGGAAAARSRGIAKIKLYGVEGDPTHFESMRQHFRDNGLDPGGPCLLQAAVGVAAGRARWPKVEHPEDDWGSRPLGAVDQAAEQSQGGSERDYLGRQFDAHLIVEVVPIAGLLEREPVWDLVHIDVQGGELDLCRAAADLLNQRVRWLVIGTHSRKIDGDLLELLFQNGWVLENEKPSQLKFNPSAPTLEAMHWHDGTQVWRNPRLT